MSTAGQHHLSLETAGVLLTPSEFDSADFDRRFRYELINGVVIVSPATSPFERGPNELLGHWLLTYQTNHANGKQLDATLPESDVFVGEDRRRADRLIWAGLGRTPRIEETPTIAVEFVSAGRRNFTRDYVEKRTEYMNLGVREYWVIDRFARTMTVYRQDKEAVITEDQVFETDLLPGFTFPLRELFAAADRWTNGE